MRLPLINRWYQMLQLFVMRPSLSLEELKKRTQTSSQTVKSSIELLNEQLGSIAEINQTGSLYTLKVFDYDAFDAILSGRLKEQSDFNSPSKRMAYILQKLLDTPDYVLIDDLSQELEVSRGTVNNDLKHLKRVLADYDSSLKGTPNRGLKLVGEELNLRLLCLNHAYDYFHQERLTGGSLSQVKQLAEVWKLDSRSQILWEKVICLTIDRIKKGRSIDQPIPHFLNMVERTKAIDDFLGQLELDYSISLGHYDIDFLLFPVNMKWLGDNPWQLAQLEEVFLGMMAEIHEAMLVELDDQQIFDEVKQHLFFLINRLIFRLEPADLFQDEIMRNYPFAYQLSAIGIHHLERMIGRKAPKAEISYLAIYFELVLRSIPKDEKKEIAVVCVTGRGTAALIRRQIESVLGAEVKIHQFLENDYEQADLDNFFAVFTTVPLNYVSQDTPVIQITNLFSDDWLRSEWNRVNQEQLSRFDFVDFHFKKFTKAQTYRESLTELLEELSSSAQVDAEFSHRVLAREEKNTTIFSNGIAFPHAIVQNTERILFAAGVFDQRIETSDGPVELLFLVGIPEILSEQNEHELLVLYDIIFTLAAEVNRQDLQSLQDVEGFKEFLRGEEIL